MFCWDECIEIIVRESVPIGEKGVKTHASKFEKMKYGRNKPAVGHCVFEGVQRVSNK